MKLVCANYLAGVVLDRFGADIWMVPQDEDHFSANVTVTVSPQFFGWVTAIGEDMEIAGPADVKEQYKQYSTNISARFTTYRNPHKISILSFDGYPKINKSRKFCHHFVTTKQKAAITWGAITAVGLKANTHIAEG